MRYTRASLEHMVLAFCAIAAGQAAADSRVRTVPFVDGSVVEVRVHRGQITQIVFDADEQLVGSPVTGKGSSCGEATHTWCVAVQGGDIFVKPKTGAEPTNLIATTNRRRHIFMLVPVSKAASSVMRLSIVAQRPAPAPAALETAAGPPPLAPHQVVEIRLQAKPTVRNDSYSVATGEHSDDIVPDLVFDDGARTYFRFANNRPIPTIFQMGPDGAEEMVNVRMDPDDLLVADRVARRFVLRLGRSVASVINEAFDLDGEPPVDGTAVPGVARVLKSQRPPKAQP